MAVTGNEPVSTADLKMACDALGERFSEIYSSIQSTINGMQDQINWLYDDYMKPVTLFTGNATSATVNQSITQFKTLTISGTTDNGSTPYTGTVSATVGRQYVDAGNGVYVDISQSGSSYIFVPGDYSNPKPVVKITSIVGNK